MMDKEIEDMTREELEEYINEVIIERDYYKKMYSECNDAFLQKIDIKPRKTAVLDNMQKLYYANGDVINLSRNDNIVLDLLIREKGKVVTFSMLEWALYHQITNNAASNIRTIVKRLRQKINGVLDIKTKRGRGYYI